MPIVNDQLMPVARGGSGRAREAAHLNTVLWETVWQDIVGKGPGAVGFPDCMVQQGLRQLLPKTMPNTRGWTEAQQFPLYACYVLAFGNTPATQQLAHGSRVILGLRVPTSTKANHGQGRYDDRFVVLHRHGHGTRGTAREFDGNTEPTWQYDARNQSGRMDMGKDVNSDGQVDLGRIPPGTFEFAKGESDRLGPILRPVRSIRLERDSNHDGRFGNDRFSRGQKSNLSANDTFFHEGGRTNTYSAGCQTLRPGVFDAFWRALGSQSTYPYVLTTLNRG